VRFGGQWCDGERARELARVGAAMAARFVRLGMERAREKGRGASEASVGFVASLRTSRPDRWGRGQRTAATARPRGGTGLRPVSHIELTKLNSTESRFAMTN
jgi:hypothetical protein